MESSTVADRRMFSGKRLLIVENSLFLSDEARRALQKLGTIIVGPTDDLDAAADMIEGGEVDAAILDINIAAAEVFPLVERLDAKSLPYVFALADMPSMTTSFAGFVLCDRVASIDDIAKALFGSPLKSN